tara:strand:- start:266 stop:538 length:273 start_codon:yes stop_codon:yes gene_type:complete
VEIKRRNNIMIIAGKNETEAKANALQASIDNKGHYITLYSCFGIFMKVSKSLHVFDPSDSLFGVYWLNGKEKPFTMSQKIRDEQSTPSMN